MVDNKLLNQTPYIILSSLIQQCFFLVTLHANNPLKNPDKSLFADEFH